MALTEHGADMQNFVAGFLSDPAYFRQRQNHAAANQFWKDVALPMNRE